MRALIRAELLKLGTRTAGGLLLATLSMVVIAALFSVPKAGDHDALVPLDDPTLLTVVVATTFEITMVLVVLLGGLSVTQEFRYGTATATYLGEPRRSRVLAAKLLSQVLVSVAITTTTLALSLPLTVVLIHSRHGTATVSTRFWQTVGLAYVVMAAYSVIGVAIGALVRNQVVVAVGALVYLLAVEHMVIPAWPSVGRWIPGGATMSILRLGPSDGLGGQLLSVGTGALVLLGYAVVALGLVVLAPRRDVP